MAKTTVYLDPIGNSMNIWWGKPSEAHSSEEVSSPLSNDVVVKDKNGVPIGLEIIGVFPEELNIASLMKKYGKLGDNGPFLLEAHQ